MALGDVPLAWHERIRRNEREVACAQRFDVADAANIREGPAPDGHLDDESLDRSEIPDDTRAAALERSRDLGPARSRLEPDRDASRRCEPGKRERNGGRGEQ